MSAGSAQPPGADDPKLGSFLSADSIVPAPLDPQSLNRYAYAGANPLRFSDPSGHTKLCGAACEDGYKWSPVTKKGGGSSSGGSTGARGGHGGGFGGGGGGGSYFGGDSSKATNGGRRTTQTGYSSAASTREAWMLVFSWFFEVGPQTWYFGPESSLTQDVMHDAGMNQFRLIWKEAGYPVPFRYEHTADIREDESLPVRAVSGGWIFLREHLIQLPLSTMGLGSRDPQGSIDPVGGIIGSLDQIYVTPANNGIVRFTVYNVTGWESGTRIPGTDHSLIQNRNRDAWGPGGSIQQYFYWWEPMPQMNGQ